MLSHTTWRLEQLQTRARIQASQSRFWVRSLLGLWLTCTALVFVLAMSKPPRAQYAPVWVLSSLPIKTVSWNKQRYDRKEMAGWLNAEVYHGSLIDWLVWASGLATLPVVLLATGGFYWIKRKGEGVEHIRGAEVISQQQLQVRLAREGKAGLTIAGVKIPEALERSHVLVCGATGSGKTVTIRRLLRQIARAGDAAIVVDPEGEFTQEFYDESRGDWLLNPLDARFPGWNPWAEGETEAETAAQAASLFPIVPGMAEAAAYYHSAARRTYRELLQHARVKDPSQIPQFLADAVKDKGSKLATKEVISTMQNALDAFRYLTPGTGRGWSAKTWVEKRKGWVFLTFRETEKDALLPLVSLWLESLTRRLLSQEIAPQRTTYVVIDELAVLKAQPTLAELMSRGRKRGVSIVLGFQDVQQLIAIYGRYLTSSLLNQPSTRLLLRTNDGETQKWCAENIGGREVSRVIESETIGPENVRDSLSRSYQRREENAVLPAEFGNLPSLEGFLKVAHHGTARVKIQFAGLEAKNPAFLPRQETAPVKPIISKSRRSL